MNGKSFRVTPYVCASEGGSFAQMGLGMMFEDGTSFMWGVSVPRCLVQCWRGMKILETLPQVNGQRTLANCWHAGAREIDYLRRPHIDELAEQFANRQKFDNLRTEILSKMPPEINEMIKICQSKGIIIDINELQSEARLGNLRVDIDGLLKEERRKQQRRKSA
ncbi:MAG: hypothetical protein WC120_01130 [Parcubacteria group bacterium]